MNKYFLSIFGLIKSILNPKMIGIYKDQIRQFVSSICTITDKDWKLFDTRLIFKEYKKNEVITQAGEVENYIYFLADGIARIYHYKNDIEYTLRFNFPISVFNSYSSFISRTPSIINIEALTDLTVFRVTYQDMQSLYDESPNADRMGRKMIELLYIQREIKEIQMQSMTAEENYLQIVKNIEALIQKIPQKYLASYLGIAPESLSRIKRKLNL